MRRPCFAEDAAESIGSSEGRSPLSLAAEPLAAPQSRKTSAKAKPKGDAPYKFLVAALEDAKAEDVVVIDVAEKSSFADTMIVATGRSNTHVAAIADRVARALKEAGAPPPRVEGLSNAEWVLVDAGSTILHVFRPETRQFYNLEKLWGDARPGEAKAAPVAPKVATAPARKPAAARRTTRKPTAA
jgi:ribosome-associated protein